jgi:prepilin-type processing-associated H-X9-DG protein
VPRVRLSFACAAVAAISCLCWAGMASAKPILLRTIAKQLALEPGIHAADATLTPPAPPCPESGNLPAPFSNFGLPETPATSLPYMGNMAFWGGHVQVHPKEYLVFWGWASRAPFRGEPAHRNRLPRVH